jgi:hypothetical protein
VGVDAAAETAGVGAEDSDLALGGAKGDVWVVADLVSGGEEQREIPILRT